MNNDTFDLNRIKNAVEHCANSPIIIISNKLEASKMYKEKIEHHLELNQNILQISNRPGSYDGFPFLDCILLLCDRWWDNKNAFDILSMHAKFAKLVIPVTYIPPSRKGGD